MFQFYYRKRLGRLQGLLYMQFPIIFLHVIYETLTLKTVAVPVTTFS